MCLFDKSDFLVSFLIEYLHLGPVIILVIWTVVQHPTKSGLIFDFLDGVIEEHADRQPIIIKPKLFTHLVASVGEPAQNACRINFFLDAFGILSIE